MILRKFKKLIFIIYQFVFFKLNLSRRNVKNISEIYWIEDLNLHSEHVSKFTFLFDKTFNNVDEIESYLSQRNDIDGYDINSFHFFIKKNQLPNSDNKIPWEIGRFNFLSYLYFQDGFNTSVLISKLLKTHQISNVAHGVQWQCAMDVAIRLVNVVLTSKTGDLTKYFDFIQSSIDYIILNLEKYGDWRGNHYLSNLAGLIIGTSIINDRKNNSIFCFALNELDIELDRQFNEDGSNFEGSTAYHLFGMEILATLFVVLNSVDISKKESHSNYVMTNIGFFKVSYDSVCFIEIINKLKVKLEKAIKFSNDIVDENGRLIQIGDNDSGVFFRTAYCKSNNQDYVINVIYQAVSAIKHSKFKFELNDERFYNVWFHNYIQMECNIKNKVYCYDNKSNKPKFFLSEYSNVKSNMKVQYKFDIRDFNGITYSRFYDDFGLIVLKGNNFLLTIRCGNIGQLGKGGHDHYDQLSLTLYINKKRLISDPGTGCYGKDIKVRNLYRSSAYHFGIKLISDIDDVSSLFSINSAPSNLVYLDKKNVICRQFYQGANRTRMISIKKNKLHIYDMVDHGTIKKNDIDDIVYSSAYGHY